MLLGTMAGGPFVLNFEFDLLEFIWDLDFGAWNFLMSPFKSFIFPVYL
jgi:hypothetical protein